MGGLDAKHMLWFNRNEHFEMKIASITTIGMCLCRFLYSFFFQATPHWGSNAARYMLENV
jgi:hypothetical protein